MTDPRPVPPPRHPGFTTLPCLGGAMSNEERATFRRVLYEEISLDEAATSIGVDADTAFWGLASFVWSCDDADMDRAAKMMLHYVDPMYDEWTWLRAMSALANLRHPSIEPRMWEIVNARPNGYEPALDVIRALRQPRKPNDEDRWKAKVHRLAMLLYLVPSEKEAEERAVTKMERLVKGWEKRGEWRCVDLLFHILHIGITPLSAGIRLLIATREHSAQYTNRDPFVDRLTKWLIDRDSRTKSGIQDIILALR